MIPAEILRRVREIEIRTRRIVNDTLSGEYQSAFKGRGMEFSEVREYTDGDEIRTIDWNVTARTGKPFVKIYREERELTVLFVVDASGSGLFGTRNRMKGEMGVELCAVLAFSAIRNNDKVGLLIFTSEVELFIPPKKGRNHVLRVIRELLYFRPRHKGTDIAGAISYFTQAIRKKCVAFLVSDFLDAGDYARALRTAARKHDLIAVTLSDPLESTLPPVGLIEFEDAETGLERLVDSSHPVFREVFHERAERFKTFREDAFRRAGVERIAVSTDRDYVEPVVAFFRRREKKR